MSSFIETRADGRSIERRPFQITRIFPGALLTGAFAALTTEVIAWFAVGGLGVSSSFAPLSAGATAPVTIGAALVAMAIYAAAEHFSANPERLFIQVSLAALALSFVPLIVLAVSPALVPGTTASALVALGMTHLAAFAVIMIGLVCTARAMEEGL